MLKICIRRLLRPLRPVLLPIIEAKHHRLAMAAYEKTFSGSGRQWNYTPEGYWIGGHFPISNCSHGYHGLLKQWWEYFPSGRECLLISETMQAKREFEQAYPDNRFTTLDLYSDIQGGQPDIKADICQELAPHMKSRFDLIICQATLEHVYDPWGAMRNLISVLNPKGVIVTHTHTPAFPYHAYPRDYCRFCVDWFEDLCLQIRGTELLELHATKGHIFSALRKVSE